MVPHRYPPLLSIATRHGTLCTGMGLGVLLLDDVYPAFPGDIRNPSGFAFPIQYEVVEGIDIEALVIAQDKEKCLPPILRAARRLQRLGCRAIVGECGYFALYQREVASEISVPVFLSSLLQVSLAQQVVGPRQVVGVLVADSPYLTQQHLEAVGVIPGSNYVIGGALDGGACPELDKLWTPGKRSDPPAAVYEVALKQFLQVATAFFSKHPNMGAMVLECTGFPPFARALQREIGIPIFSYGTLVEFAYSVVAHREYRGDP